ncbi:uncharacterized protein DUF4339 [Bradyrhizobium macuxiense]|uniref:Uncharacterized protein DUF4339 n=1 Tax=Bradyrhizobium macuxiense TaxID=1755647 RepID=A0A560LZL3_9BRAD|nr:uncharacterized protein DUF4339 [Bradyrhizobium macuxiense]
MSNRSWFYASDGQQKGPCSDAELRDLYARRKLTPDTLVWSEGMASWTKAGEVPGLLSDPLRPAQSFGRSASIGGGPAADKIQELDITLGRLLRIYWLFIWRSLLGSVAIGFVLGLVIGFVLGALGEPRAMIKTVTGPVGAIAGLIWSIVCLRMALEKKYSDFRIALVPRDIEPG